MSAVVVADVEIDREYHFESQEVGTTPAELGTSAEWRAAGGWGSRHCADFDRLSRAAATVAEIVPNTQPLQSLSSFVAARQVFARLDGGSEGPKALVTASGRGWR